jgi:hypothetical protein
LSGWPSVTDSDVNKRRDDDTFSPRVQRLLASDPRVRAPFDPNGRRRYPR